MEKSPFLGKILPLILVVLGGLIVVGFVATRPEPAKTNEPESGKLVQTVEARLCQVQPTVTAKGTLQARRRISLYPQVGGKVVSTAPDFEAGGLFREGETFLQIDRQDYQLALEAEQSRLLDAQAALEEARAQHEVSRKELELYRNDESVDPRNRPLVLNIPQLTAAQAAVEAAEAALARAELDLERTTLKAPFDGMLLQETADVGQLLTSNSQVAEFVGVDAFDVLVSLPVDQLPHIDADAETGSRAHVHYQAGSNNRTLTGRVIRKLADVEPAGRMARLLVRVEDPLSLQEAGQDNAQASELVPLLLDAYVDVSIETNKSLEAVVLPRELVHEENKVHLYQDGQLHIQSVDVRWREPETLVVQGLPQGAELVATRIAAPVDGLPLRRDEQTLGEQTPCASQASSFAPPQAGAEQDSGTEVN